MDKDRVKGKMKDIGGRVQRQAGEWTGDSESQAKGLGKQVEGKVQNTVGKMKDAGRKAAEDLDRDRDRDVDIHEEKDIKRRKVA